MAEYYGGDYLYTTLSTDSAVQAITTAIYNARMIPSDETSAKTVNFYATSPTNPRLEYFEARWSIDCRAPIESDALDLATAVVAAINRKHKTEGTKSYFGVVDILWPIPPANDADVYNVPVQVYIRRR